MAHYRKEMTDHLWLASFKIVLAYGGASEKFNICITEKQTSSTLKRNFSKENPSLSVNKICNYME